MTSTREDHADVSATTLEELAMHRPRLHRHCYRMLGSLHDADDAVQEAMTRAWRGLDRFDGRSSMGTWLHAIATNVCLTAIDRRQRRPLPVDLTPPSDPQTTDWTTRDQWLEPYPTSGLPSPELHAERVETLGLAFVAACQRLPPLQRAVLLLREVHGFSAREVADILETTVPAVNSALQRARRTLRREPAQASSHGDGGDRSIADLADAYVDAWERGDVAGVVALLAADATFQMPPIPVWFRGRSDIERFLPLGPMTERWRLVPTSANGQLAFGCYAWDGPGEAFVGHSLDVLTVVGGEIRDITAFLRPDLLGRFGLPSRL